MCSLFVIRLFLSIVIRCTAILALIVSTVHLSITFWSISLVIRIRKTRAHYLVRKQVTLCKAVDAIATNTLFEPLFVIFVNFGPPMLTSRYVSHWTTLFTSRKGLIFLLNYKFFWIEVLVFLCFTPYLKLTILKRRTLWTGPKAFTLSLVLKVIEQQSLPYFLAGISAQPLLPSVSFSECFLRLVQIIQDFFGKQIIRASLRSWSYLLTGVTIDTTVNARQAYSMAVLVVYPPLTGMETVLKPAE